MTAVRSHTTNSQNGDPTVRPMSAETMKIPEPIIEPATSIVASVNVSARTNSWRSALCDAAASGATATLCIVPLWRVGSRRASHDERLGGVVRPSHAPAGGGPRTWGAARAQETYAAPEALARAGTPARRRL